jgi:multiple sugar transport system permease protein
MLKELFCDAPGWRKIRLPSSESATAWLFVSPSLFFLIMFIVLPIAISIYYSFGEIKFWRGSIIYTFIGFLNYKHFFSEPSFLITFIQTLLYTILRTAGSFLLGTAIALLMAYGGRVAKVFKLTFLLPWAISYVVNSIMWSWMFHGSYGILNEILVDMHIIRNYRTWLAAPGLTLYVIAFIDIWKNVPFTALAIFAGLQNVPRELYDAAKIDGASFFQQLWYVVVPYLLPLCIIVILFQLIWALRAFDSIWTLTKGGFGTDILNIVIFRETFIYTRIGYGAAIAVILALLTLVFAIQLIKRVK